MKAKILLYVLSILGLLFILSVLHHDEAPATEQNTINNIEQLLKKMT